jgi:hypothetical protein
LKGGCPKFGNTMYTPFKVLSVGHNGRYCKLELPATWNNLPTFDIALLKQYQGKNPEILVIEIEANYAGCKME